VIKPAGGTATEKVPSAEVSTEAPVSTTIIEASGTGVRTPASRTTPVSPCATSAGGPPAAANTAVTRSDITARSRAVHYTLPAALALL